MASYIKSHLVYKCPADGYVKSGVPGPRVRSLSMNAALLGIKITIENQIPNRTYFSATKMAQLARPGPAMIFVALDEHPDSINDSVFHVIAGRSIANAEWRDVPASYHNGACGFTFADGHSEIKKWLERSGDKATVLPVKYQDLGNIPVRGSRDYVWVNDRMPYTE
jgi:prepilin-type processing-associated H-X9-DG protein